MRLDFGAFVRDRGHLGLRRSILRAAYYRVAELANLAVYRLLMLSEATANPELLERDTPYSIRPLEPAELDVFARDPSNRLEHDFVAESIEREDVCLAVTDGEQLASFGWYSRRPTVVEDGVTIHFPHSHVYMLHGYTKPAYRGQNLVGLGMVAAARLFGARGYEGVLALVDWGNYASLSAAYRSGYRACGIAARLEVAGRSRLWVSAAGRRNGIRLEGGGVRLYGSPSD